MNRRGWARTRSYSRSVAWTTWWQSGRAHSHRNAVDEPSSASQSAFSIASLASRDIDSFSATRRWRSSSTTTILLRGHRVRRRPAASQTFNGPDLSAGTEDSDGDARPTSRYDCAPDQRPTRGYLEAH